MVRRPTDQELVARGREVKGCWQVTAQRCQSGTVGSQTWEGSWQSEGNMGEKKETMRIESRQTLCPVCVCVCGLKWLLHCMLMSVCVFCFTIKNLQHIKLLLSVETLKGDGDVVSFLYCNAPWTHLQVGVAFWPTGAQDDTRRVVSHIMRGALDCGADNAKGLYAYVSLLHQFLSIHFLMSLLKTHLGMLVEMRPSGVSLQGDMLESHCQPERIQDGICTWWCHLDIQNRDIREKTNHPCTKKTNKQKKTAHLSPVHHPPSAWQHWALLGEAGKPLIGRLGEQRGWKEECVRANVVG